jgi:hypothetical protein
VAYSSAAEVLRYTKRQGVIQAYIEVSAFVQEDMLMGMVVVQAHAVGIGHLDTLYVVVRDSLHKKKQGVVEVVVLRDYLMGSSIPLLENDRIVPSRSLEAQHIQEVLDQLVQTSHMEVPSNWVEASPDREGGQSIGHEAGIDFAGTGDLI